LALDLVVKNVKLFYRGALVEAAVGVDGGRVVRVAKEASMPKADHVFDAGGFLMLPGMVDAHVHFRDPGYLHEEDFSSGTAAAACGGVTTVADMPNNEPPVVDHSSWRLKLEAVKGKAYVDYALYAAASWSHLEDLPTLIEEGAAGVKAYMAHGRPTLQADPQLISAALREAGLKVPVLVHAEDGGLLERGLKVGFKDPIAYAKARGPMVEALAVRKVLRALARVGGRVHLCHLSSAWSVKLVEEAKLKGLNVTAETCPHYLLLTKRDLRRAGVLCKVDPPVRAGHHRVALWRGLWRGVVDQVASDHAPHRLEDRLAKGFAEAPSGFAGVELTLSLLLDCVNRGLLRLADVVSLYSTRPARLLNLYPRKGVVEEGCDADLVLVSMGEEFKVTSSRLHSKSPETPFEGRVLKGVPKATFIRGVLAAEEGEVKVKPGLGRFLKPVGGGFLEA
jgi:dihydroorotase